MGAKEIKIDPGKINKEIWRAGAEYLEERQTQVSALLEAALIINDIYTSQVYGESVVIARLPSGEMLDLTPAIPIKIIEIASALSEELDDLSAITPEIEELWIEVRETYDLEQHEDIEGEETDYPEDPPLFPPASPSLN